MKQWENRITINRLARNLSDSPMSAQPTNHVQGGLENISPNIGEIDHPQMMVSCMVWRKQIVLRAAMYAAMYWTKEF